jgi:hypothetical protein
VACPTGGYSKRNALKTAARSSVNLLQQRYPNFVGICDRLTLFFGGFFVRRIFDGTLFGGFSTDSRRNMEKSLAMQDSAALTMAKDNYLNNLGKRQLFKQFSSS